MIKLPPPSTSRKEPFFQRQDWLISAGLTMVIYLIMLIMVYHFLPGPSLTKWLVHIIPVLAGAMAWHGIKERDQKTSRDRLIRFKRRQAEQHLKDLAKPVQGIEPPPPLDEERK